MKIPSHLQWFRLRPGPLRNEVKTDFEKWLATLEDIHNYTKVTTDAEWSTWQHHDGTQKIRYRDGAFYLADADRDEIVKQYHDGKQRNKSSRSGGVRRSQPQTPTH